MIVSFERATSADDALERNQDSHTYLAGGTDLIPLMRIEPRRAWHLVDLRDAGLSNEVSLEGDRVFVGAATTLAQLAAHPLVVTHATALAQAAGSSASPQVRNRATLGGNLLQRTRCRFFRDPLFSCNKRVPGSGCPALAGDRSRHAILGVSPSCVAVHASDCAVALLALGARLHLRGLHATRIVALKDFYVPPGETPWRETALAPGELVMAIDLARAPRAAYVKIRDRASFEFAVVSAAVAERATRTGWVMALGGVAPMPWLVPGVARALSASAGDRAALARAFHREMEGATTNATNAYKVDLALGAVIRAAAVADRER